MHFWVGRIAAVILGFSLLALAQGGASPSAKSGGFRWDFRKAQELDFKDGLKNNKVLSADQKRALVAAISAQYRPNKGDRDALSPSEIREVAVHTRVKLVDLNGDGTSEIVAQPIGDEAGCGATGNCPIWIFEPSGAGYKLLLDGTAQTFTVQPGATNGYSDLVLGQHASASEQVLYVYSFRDGRYRRGACYDANWLIFTAKELKEPRITRCNWK